jgi:hypothetical protein
VTTRTDNLVIPQGSTWGIIIPVVNPDGTAATLTGWAARGQVRAFVASSTVLFEWSVAAGNATISGSNVTLTVDAATSAAWVCPRRPGSSSHPARR